MQRGAGTESAVRYLDGDAERRALVADIHAVRQTVIMLARDIPQEEWYDPRYHGWSLAAMLSHLHFMDSLALMQIKLALVGIHLSVSSKTLDRINDMTSRFFRRRLLTTTIRDIEKNEPRIDDLILRLPMERFTRTLKYPPTGETLTVERAVQQYFLFHWQHHLATMQSDGDDVYYEPPRDLLV